MLKDRKVTVIGLGTMGTALVQGLIETETLPRASIRATVRHAEHAQERAATLGIEVGTDNEAAARSGDLLLLCTKPRVAPGVLTGLAAAGALDHDPLVISVAAGVSSAALERASEKPLRVVRSMPNTPCLIGEGMTVVAPGRHASGADLAAAEAVFQPLGRVRRLDEEHMDTVTGLSGSGPAFVYVILEALSEGGVMMGLPRAVALELAAQTVQGAARMVLETGRHPAALKDDVLTPAGCTISALLLLEDGRLRSVLARGVQEAARAARGLGEPS